MASTKNLPFDRMTSGLYLTSYSRSCQFALFLILFTVASFSSNVQATTTNDSRLIVSRQRIVITRPRDVVRRFPKRKTAIMYYPIISGLSDAAVLKRVRAILKLKNIFDYSLEEYRQDTWLTEFNYGINYNARHIFDITFTQEGVAAYPDSQSKHFTIDLRTGKLIKASDVFLRSRFAQLAELVNEKMQIELRQLIKQAKDSPNLDVNEGSSIAEALSDMKFEVKNLDDFSVGAKGVTFLYDAGFPHAIAAFEPEGRYFFSYAQLKPYLKSDGLLWQFQH